jgi:hypothetical protein
MCTPSKGIPFAKGGQLGITGVILANKKQQKQKFPKNC